MAHVNNNRAQRVRNSRSFVQDPTNIDNKEQFGKPVEPLESLDNAQRNNESSTTLGNSNAMISNPNISLPKMDLSESMIKDSVISNSSIQPPLSSNSQPESNISEIQLKKNKQLIVSDETKAVHSENSNAAIPRQVIKETVFSSEIHSIEYDSSLTTKSNASIASEVRKDKKHSMEAKQAVLNEPNARKASNAKYTNFEMTSHMDTTSAMLEDVNPIDTACPRQEEMVVFDDIGDMNLQYISNSSSNLIKNTSDPVLQQFITEEPKNDCDVNVTYDLIQGTLPPPSTSGLRVRPQDDNFVSNNQSQVIDMPPLEESIDNLYLGEEAAASIPTKTIQESDILSSPIDNAILNDHSKSRENTQCKPMSIINSGKKPSGLVEIAQYEGSPRRYKPRISSEIVSNASSGDDRPHAATNLIDDDQNNLLLHSPLKQSKSKIHTLDPMHRDDINLNISMVDELLKFDDVLLPQASNGDGPGTYSNITSRLPSDGIPASKSDFDFRYEFSETRKVLDEFFSNAENEFPAHPNRNSSVIKGNDFDHVKLPTDDKNYGLNDPQDGRMGNDFNDLNYTLRRFSPNSLMGSTTVGQRLAGNEEELIKTTLISNPSTSASSSIRSSDISHITDQKNLSIPSKSMVTQNNHLPLQHNIIQGFDPKKMEHNEPSQATNTEQHKIPSNTYQYEQHIGDMPSKERAQFTSNDFNSLSVSTELSGTTPSMAPGFRAIDDNSTNIPTSNKLEVSTCPSDQNHIKKYSDDIIVTEQSLTKDTQKVVWENPSQPTNSHATNSSLVIPIDQSQANSLQNSRQKEAEVSCNNDLSVQSTNQIPSPKSDTALVGNMRLNVARHYLADPCLEDQQVNNRNKELNIPCFENTPRESFDRDNQNVAKFHSQIGKINTEPLKSSQPLNSPYVTESKNIGAVTMNTSNVSFLSGPLGPEKENNIVHSMSMMSNSLAPSGPLDSRNFTLSPETTDCDSADLESEVSINEGSYHSSGPKFHTAMPILEDGLSSGHASDLEDDVIYSR